MNLMILGDLNGRLSSLEPRIRTDHNGKMIEKWVQEYSLTHMNAEDRCVGLYTFGKIGEARSAIDHILVNQELYSRCGGMKIDETGEEVGFSDHNVAKMEMNLGQKTTHKWNTKGEREVRVWYRKDKESLDKFEKELATNIRDLTSFDSLCNKIEIAQDRTLKKVKR